MSRVYYPEARIVVKAVIENFGDSRRPLDFPAIPKKVSIRRNSYRQPDSWSVEFDGKDFPIPPSLLRSAQVEIYLYDKKGLVADRRLLRSTVKPAIVGLVDSASARFSGDGRLVTFEGQDMTALLSEHKFQKGRRNLTNKRLDKALNDLLREVDITGQMQLVTEIPFKDSKLPIIGKSVSRTNRNGFPVKRGDSYWDVMYNLALKHGFILFVRDLEVVLATPESVHETSQTRADRTFKLTWGKNVEEIEMSRNMGKQRVPQCEVLSYDERTRKVLVGRYPEAKQKVTTGVGTKRNEVVTSVLRGITDVETLKRLARAQYSLISRTEQEVHMSTRELQDEGDANLLYLKAGDAMFVSFDPFNAEELRKIPAGQRSQFLVARGWTRQAANVFAAHFDQLATFRKPFYVREASLEWDNDSGLSINVSMVNFVNVEGTQEKGSVKGAAENV